MTSNPKVLEFCGKHQSMIANRLRHLGLWSKVKDPAMAAEIAQAWMAGLLKKEYLCPLVITLLELQAKAQRMFAQGHGWNHDRAGRNEKGAVLTTCPCCAMQRMKNDETVDVKVINGQCDVTLGLMQSNGLAGGEAANALAIARAQALGQLVS